MNIDPSLLDFYHGSLTESERLEIERKMLSDPIHLLDFLDLKRELDGAAKVPETPSAYLWHRLAKKIPTSRRAQISLVVGLTFACLLWLSFTLWPKQTFVSDSSTNESRTLFDSGHEQPGLSDVL